MKSDLLTLKGRSGGHCQGIAIDKERKYIYYSFTTELVKTDLSGNVIGSCKGLVGHLGCIAMNYEENMLYGTLEFKHDSIGKGIFDRLGINGEIDDGFYCVSFDCSKIVRENMDAETDGIMKAVFLKEVLDDYKTEGHKYGCSGIDGITFAPSFGGKSNKLYIYIAYGIYKNLLKDKDDYQVILKYDPDELKRKELPLNQKQMHRSGPLKPMGKYFLYTGNTNWGIQNLEYDCYRNVIMAAVYKGSKEEFPNYNMFFIDMDKEAETKEIIGYPETGQHIFLKDIGQKHYIKGISGSYFPLGSTGMISLGDGRYIFSDDFKEDGEYGTTLKLYKAADTSDCFEAI